ncbi:hypothetical protein SERLA73DRAFT_179998 [Serpula lacrymans var. lacrymans S7.3]|uniref:GmrSD restriction endonucleases N-terminal domain-containing protein n=2 Tax=Serpula lacrymans var. lacrymans TaxID=341189 RepID=F8PV93_SERL3|nr:uncharacterized protein SERLADRAFT_465396 [Serpula lacrymans var. lacrymans S7.9]EGN99785.1 hypothetical protein SERLA73DRAFT_179998 [Serpula lacrymans var. lacrymans S7.3]EGO25359.1 hypothetical protein SERLADRAFT_465396 [Serpula lacrymans var. lacrymans S7.9]
MSYEQDKDIDELMDDLESEDPNVFRIHDQLSPPSAKSYSTKDLHVLVHQSVINLNPSYQRDIVWPESKQIGLIDSIFRNFYIPPLVFAVHIDDDGEEVRTCVDGKQRLTSIQKFLDGQIPHRDFKTKKNFWYTLGRVGKATQTEIPEPWKHVFCNKQITCVEYHGLPPGTERDIFQRVQLGMSLTAAEKLQAIASPWAEWIAALDGRHVDGDDGLASVLTWDIKRGRDFQCIAQFVYCCDGLPDHLLPTAQKLEKWLVRVDSPPHTFKQQISDVLSEFWHIAKTPALNAAFVKVDKRVAPVEFVFIGVLLYVMRNHTHEDRAKALLHMRLHVRDQFRDIRNNTVTGKVLWDYITSVTAPGGLKELGGIGSEGSSSTKKGRKRKNEDDVYDADEDYRPSPIRSFGPPTKTRSRAKK